MALGGKAYEFEQRLNTALAKNKPNITRCVTCTRSSGGAGLGLAITHSIVEAHGGKITAASTQGEGSVFKVALPLAGAV